MIVHVVPDGWGPYVDVRACLKSLSKRRSSTYVLTPREANPEAEFWQDPDALAIYWPLLEPVPREARRCKVVHVYSEAIDTDLDKLLPAHRGHWYRFRLDLAQHFDAVFTHTPWTSEVLKHAGMVSFVMPVGWDAEAMGTPRDGYKLHDFVYHGSLTGRRELIVPYLQKRLGLVDVTGSFGRGLLGQLDLARASIYIAHSLVGSFSTWRLWQTASTRAALVAEPGDAWPFEAGKHYIQIESLTVDNAERMVDSLLDLATQHDHLEHVANEAHTLARLYTVDRIEDEFVIPAKKALR